VATVCVFATFAGDVALILAEWYCGNKNLLNALRHGNKHTGVLWLSDLFLFNRIINLKIKNIMKINKYYGIGKDFMGGNKWTFNIFLGNKMVCIAYYTRKYKFRPRFYFYSNIAEMQEDNFFSLSWFVGLIF